MIVPSGAVAGASAAASALVVALRSLATALPMPADASATLSTELGRLARVTAPGFTTPDDVAACAASLVTLVQNAARAADPADAAPALYGAAVATVACPPRSASAILTRDYALARALAASIETACLGEAFLAEARTTFGDRRAATEARERIAASLDASQDRIAAALGQEVVSILTAAAREASGRLVRLGADLQPVVRVNARISVPSTALAWSLYADPARADDLVARNRVGTPLFMPAVIEALSPGAT